MSPAPSPFLRRHSVRALRSNPPRPSARARRRKATPVARRRATPVAAAWRQLGTAHRLVLCRGRQRVSVKLSAGTRAEYRPGRAGMRLTGPDLAHLRRWLPARPERVEYAHEGGGSYGHDFSPAARAQLDRAGAVVITGCTVKAFIEG